MLHEKLKDKNIILASGSPRRQQFLKDLGLDFEVRLKPVREDYPPHLKGAEIAEYLAELKTKPYLEELKKNEILITGDTIVLQKNKVLAKPNTQNEAIGMLQKLSGTTHEVISSACITSTEKTVLLHAKTKVFFKVLAPEEIKYYITNFQPYDKAGAYGIQEWIGKIGIAKIEGSYYNVMGMPIAKVYAALKEF